MSEILRETKNSIYVRYFRPDKHGDVNENIIRWLCAVEKGVKWHYYLHSNMISALDWVWRYDGDLKRALDMANKLAQIVKIGKQRLDRGHKFELVLVRDTIERTITTTVLDKDNGMIVLALAAL